LYGSGAANKLPATLPEDYPTADFYGQSINGNGAAGAAQALTANGSGYSRLDLSVNNSLGGSLSASPAPDADGLRPNGSVTITATINPGYSLEWLKDGVGAGTANFLTINLTTHTSIQAVFSPALTVTVFTDGAGSNTTTGTLRYALINAQDGDVINVIGATPGTTVIELTSALPEITKNITIVGNGVTLTRAASWTSSNTSQLLRITGSTAEVKISGVHFKNGQTTEGSGGAIYNTGTLTLESCIFSGNSAYDGGGVYSSNTLSIRGCTFYENSGYYFSNAGGAVSFFYASDKTLTLTGNLFYGNSASNYPAVHTSGAYGSSITVRASYNVVDVAFGTGSAQSGWSAGTGDKTFTNLSITGNPLNTTTFAPVSGLQNVLPSTAPADFPLTDFYGATRTFPGAPGAVAAAP
jgi:predicted outer membrane repeat protein